VPAEIRLCIFGSRGFDDYLWLEEEIRRRYGGLYDQLEIVSGHARGADRLGELFADTNRVPIKLFPAEWDKYGKSAGMKRNLQMAQYCTDAIGFWDGKSKGTAAMIKMCRNNGVNLEVCEY